MSAAAGSLRAATAAPYLQWLAVPVLLALVALVYWPGLDGGFAFDDFPNIVFNRNLHVASLQWPDWIAAIFSSPASDLQRPLSMLTFAINHYFTGVDPAAMKLTNLAIHLLNTLLVLALARTLLRLAATGSASHARREWSARFITAAWALHPINLMPVLFVVQRMESLSHAFVFAGLWLYLRGRERQRAGGNGWPAIGAGLVFGTGLGLLAKESAVLLPLYAFCVEACVLRFRTRSEGPDRRLSALFAVVLLLPGAIGMLWLWPKIVGAYAFRGFSLGERLMTEARVVMDYLQWSVFPSLRELSLHHDDYVLSRGLWDPPTTLLALLGLAALVAAAAWIRRWRPLASLGLAWFLAAHVLTATVIPLELVYEHRNYFASLGICVAIADLMLLAPVGAGRRKAGMLLATAVLVVFALTTHLRAREWSDPLRFAFTEAAKHPRSPRATYTLGQVLITTSGYRDAALLQSGRDALERARRVQGSGILPHSGLLLVAAKTGQPALAEWWREMQQRLRQHPIGSQETAALASLAHCAREDGCRFPPGEMIATFESALTRGRNGEVLSIYGDYALNVLHAPQPALRMWREAAELHPRRAQYQVNLAKLLIALGHDAEARTRIDALRRLGRVGQYDAAAIELERRLQTAQRVRGNGAQAARP
jgi:hypothetical protein